MKKNLPDLKIKTICSVMNFPENIFTPDLSQGIESDGLKKRISPTCWGIGGYLEKREGMYTAPQYKNKRNVHMGVDIWTPAGEPVMAPFPGILVHKKFHPEPGNYGGTLVLKFQIADQEFFALFGHLSKKTVENAEIEKEISAGEKIGEIGMSVENGNWFPHLHFQISTVDPGEADMPGVVAKEDIAEAKQKYINPYPFLGLNG